MFHRPRRGFSLIEMIAVLTLLIVVSTLAIVSFRSPNQEASYQSRYLTLKAIADVGQSHVVLANGDAETIANAMYDEWKAAISVNTSDPYRDGNTGAFAVPGNRTSFADTTVFQTATWVRPVSSPAPVPGTPAWCVYWDFEADGSTYYLPNVPVAFRGGEVTGTYTIRKEIVAQNSTLPWRTSQGAFTSCKP